MIEAGKLREVLTIQLKNVTSRDVMGGEVFAWADFATVPAAALPLSGRELFTAQQAHAETSIRFELRYLPGVTPAMRALWQGRPYDIRSAIDVGGRGVELHLFASEGVRDG